jgi:type I restriction enzyme M protein
LLAPLNQIPPASGNPSRESRSERLGIIDLRAKARLPTDPLVHEGLFDQTRKFYAADDLFAETDRLNISEDTFRRIVKKLERFDLSKTSDDIKGLAFERFLGGTFRGNLGQFFTPRPVVNFMVDLLDPKEGETICDPAAGSGGFLIRAFEHVRAQIARDIQAQKDRAKAEIEARGLPPDEEEAAIEQAFLDLNRQLLPSNDQNEPVDTRVGRLAWECIFGCDAEPRAARTAKMNMIMHGDGHGGIHHHDGLVDINGIFAERFDIVITNPPFGSTVGNDQRVGATNETRVPTTPTIASAARATARRGGEATSGCSRLRRRKPRARAVRDRQGQEEPGYGSRLRRALP